MKFCDKRGLSLPTAPSAPRPSNRFNASQRCALLYPDDTVEVRLRTSADLSDFSDITSISEASVLKGGGDGSANRIGDNSL